MSLVKLVTRALQSGAALERRQSREGQIVALHKFRVLYFAVPKVANSSIKSICVDLLGIDVPDGTWKPSLFNTRKFDHLYDRRAVLISLAEAQKLSGYWKFAFVRNPWDRLVSCFHEKLAGDHPAAKAFTATMRRKGVLTDLQVSFPDFVRGIAEVPDPLADRHIRSQHCFLAGEDGKLLVDYVGRFERLALDFQLVGRRLGVDIELPHLLKSDRRPYKEYYSNELRTLVGERYRRDIELFEYVF